MSAIHDAIVAFADTILQHFPPFRWDADKEAAWADTMVRELSGFSVQVIERAGREIVRTRKKTQTPLVAECIEACLDARRWIEATERATTLAVTHDLATTNTLDWTADRLKLASELMDTPLGKQAAKQGWVGALWSFARKNARLPTQGKEVEGCKEAARGFDKAYAICVHEAATSGSPFMVALEKLGAEMLRRRQVIERRVLNQ